MNLQITQTFSYRKSVLLKALIAPAFHLAVAKKMGTLETELLDHQVNGEIHSIRIRRRMQNQSPVPAAIAKFASSEVNLTHFDEWDLKTSTGHLKVEIAQAPVRLKGVAVVTSKGKGCERRFDWEIKSSIPIVGKMIEDFIAKDLTQTLQKEEAIIAGLLEAYASA